MIQALVTESAVKRFHEGVLQRFAGLDEAQGDAGFCRDVGAKQIREKTRRKGREYPNANNAPLSAPERCRVKGRVTNLAEHPARADEESLARLGEMNAAMVTIEKRGSDLIFKIPNASADGRLLNFQRPGRAPQASALGGRNNVAKMAQFNRQSAPFVALA